jgi:UDP-N-acetylglucosamine acyltransferase
MMAAGSDNPEVKTINIIGMRRAGISEATIAVIRQAQKLLFREHQPLPAVRAHFEQALNGVLPIELLSLLTAVDEQRKGKMGRAREAVRDQPYTGDRKVA